MIFSALSDSTQQNFSTTAQVCPVVSAVRCGDHINFEGRPELISLIKSCLEGADLHPTQLQPGSVSAYTGLSSNSVGFQKLREARAGDPIFHALKGLLLGVSDMVTLAHLSKPDRPAPEECPRRGDLRFAMTYRP